MDGRVFALPALHGPLGTPDRCIALADPGDPEALTLFFGPAGPLAVLLDVCDLLFAEDLDDAYHLNISAGCTGKPFWSRVRAFTIDEHGQVLQRWRLVMGATLTCLGFCDTA